MRRLIAGSAAAMLVSGGMGRARSGVGQCRPGRRPALGPHTRRRGQSLWITGNHVTNPVVWDESVCHTRYVVAWGNGNVAQHIWDEPDPSAPPPPPPPGLNFCPVSPWCLWRVAVEGEKRIQTCVDDLHNTSRQH